MGHKKERVVNRNYKTVIFDYVFDAEAVVREERAHRGALPRNRGREAIENLSGLRPFPCPRPGIRPGPLTMVQGRSLFRSRSGDIRIPLG